MWLRNVDIYQSTRRDISDAFNHQQLLNFFTFKSKFLERELGKQLQYKRGEAKGIEVW